MLDDLISLLHQLLKAEPLLALFATLALGYAVGKLRVGNFVLGGVAGTLLVGVFVGQLDVTVDPAVKAICFALFIYAVGFQGGPQFFRALNLRSLNQLVSSFVMCLMGLLTVLAAAWLFGLDRGMAAGLAAGGLTQSAIIGTAGDAIGKLGLAGDITKTMQTNIAVGYAVCYIFGSLGPILMVTWFFPLIMRWNVRQEAVKLAQTMARGEAQLDPGCYNALAPVSTRVYEIAPASPMAGRSVLSVDHDLNDAAIEAIFRAGKTLEFAGPTPLMAGDQVAFTGTVESLSTLPARFGAEIVAPAALELVQEDREIVLTNAALGQHGLAALRDETEVDARRGVFLTAVKRMGLTMPLRPDLMLKRGDELRFAGAVKDLDSVQSKIGYKISSGAATDFVFFGLGMIFGLLIGMIEFRLWDVPVSIGSGGGCLLSGLCFGWLRSAYPRFAALPLGASTFLRDFGLAAFVGLVGISAGPQALAAIEKSGLTLLLLGFVVTLLPQIVTFFFSFYVLRIRNPIEALACVAGGRSANPAFAALLQQAGNATPVVAFTVTYAVANVFLTLWGPVIVGVVTKNAAP